MARDEDVVLGVDDAEVAGVVDPELKKLLDDKAEMQAGEFRQKQIEELRSRKNAFTRVFRDGGATLDDVAIVRKVLDKFCRRNESTFKVDARHHALLEGRREVILHVDDYIGLSVDDLLNKLA